MQKNIYQKLQQARVDLQLKDLKKTGKNQKFNYFELSDFLPSVNEICAKNGLFTHFNIISDQRKEKAILTVLNSDQPTEKICFVIPTDEVKLPAGQPIQNLGSKITYMRRYAMMIAFEVVESDYVEKIKESINEIEEVDLKLIKGAKNEEILTKIYKELVKKYKISLILPEFTKQKEILKQEASKA